MSYTRKVLTGGRRLLLLAVALAAAPAAARAQQPKPEELAAKAKTILTKNCFQCHGKDPARVAKKLKILDYAGLLSDKRHLVVPNAPDKSKIIQRIESADSPMPPEDNPPVPEADRKVLRDWIAAGAPDFSKKAEVTPAATTPAATTPAATTPAAPTPAPTPTPATTPTTPTPAVTAARFRSLDEELLKQAPEALDFLREKGYKNVGVLKFRVKRLGEAESDNAGPLNQTLATRLEMALALTDDDKNPVGVLRDASVAASLINKANHLFNSKEKPGRQALFGVKYPLAWGDDTLVKPEAFLTGGVRFSPDLRLMGVTLLAFGSKDVDHVYQQEEFFVTCDPGLLVEAGESFLVRDGLKTEGPLAPTKAAEAALALRNQEVLSPLLDKEAPVKLEVRYDGNLFPVGLQDGKFQLPEPKEGQKVSFVLQRQAGSNDRLGVVLKFNGQSTLFRERLPDLQCRKWVLEPGVARLTVDRVQTDAKDDKGDIKVQAVAAPKPDEFRYGPDVGTISLVVYREARGKGAAAPAGLEDVAALARGSFPNDRVEDLAALKQQLRKEGNPGNAVPGLAAPAKAGAEPQAAEFKADPTPVLALTITCTRP